MSDQGLKPGARLASGVCTTEVVVVRVSDPAVVLECGGVPMLPAGARPEGSPKPGFDGGSLIGKRYGSAEVAIEVLCVKAGAGALGANGSVLVQRSAKPLPASD
jgi:hypothetical protein